MAKRNPQTALRENARLNTRLTDYSATARTSASGGKRPGRLGNWPAYAAAAGAALAMTTNASASIITGTYNSPSNTVLPNTPGAAAYFGLGGDHVLIEAHSGIPAGGPTAAVLSVIGVSPVAIFKSAISTGFARRFAPGAQISTGPYGASGKIVKSHFAGGDYGQFSSGVPGYAGLVINVGGQLDYGWLKIEFMDSQSTGWPYALSVLAYGIETDGGPIDAGQTSEATPEPGTMALALLAAGAAGVTALRRRRLA